MKAEFLKQHGFVQPGDLVFDVGVRDGKLTREFLELGAEIVCVDARQEHVTQMEEKFGDAITVVCAAVMDKAGVGNLYSRRDDISTMVPDVYGNQIGGREAFKSVRVVQTTTLDELIAVFGFPTFIKLDIEGAEALALLGLTYPVPALCYEFGSGYIEQAYMCAEILGSDYEFNYVRGHHGEWESYWANVEDFTIDLPEKNEDDKWTWGNVFARRIDESH